MSNIEQSILDSIQILLNKRVSQLNFDHTVRATIVSVVDESIGCYLVKYQNSKFYAYSDPDQTYNEDDQVYVQIPSSDYEKTKLIVGSVKKLGTQYISAVTSEGRMTVVGTNIITNKQQVKLCSYERQTRIDLMGNYITIDPVALSTYKKQKKYILLGMSVKTSLPPEQQVAGGNYGIIVQAEYYNTAYKSQDVQTDKDLITRTYILDVNNMQGQPYKYITKNRQYTIFAIDGDNLKSIKSIQAFCKGFPVTKANKPADIFLSDFEIEFMEPLTEEEMNGGSLKILTPNGSYFKSANDDTIYLQAQLKMKGRIVNLESQHVDFYWFIKDTTVTDSDNENYSTYAGAGWRCLNQHKTYNGVTTFTPEGEKKYLRPTMAPSAYNTFKCVGVIGDAFYSGTIRIENKSASNSINITSSAGTKFYFDTGVTTLTCNVNTSILPLTFHWGYRSMDGILMELPNRSQAIEVRISEATELVTYECTVQSNGTYLGVAEITLTNGRPQNEYTLVINNGTQVFQYNEYGVSPANKSTDNPLAIPPLSFDIYNDQGQLVTPNSDEEKVKMCDIKWVWPDEEYTMLQHGTFDLSDDLIVNPTTNGNVLRRVLRNAPNLTFEIRNRYSASLTDNNIRLEIQFQGHSLVTSTNFTFVKQGENGTNGTKYICKLTPFNDIYERIYLENNRIWGYYPTVTRTYDPVYGDSITTERYNFVRASTNRPLRAQLWDGDTDPIYDSQNNTSLDPTSTWEMVDIGRETMHNAEVSAEGVITPYDFDNVNTVVKVTLETDELSEQANKYYATYPLDVAQTPNTNIHAIVTGGFRECMFENDGTRSSFKSKPFSLRIFKDGVEQVLDNSKISWYTSWYTDKKNEKLQSQNDVKIDPPSMYDSETTNNYIVVTYSDNSGDYKVIISVHFYLNRYGMAAMNEWDGNSIKINEDGDQYIVAPQIGAGQKDEYNRFTGITMGKSFNANGNGQREIGLMGFASGQRSIFLDAETGKAQFGLPGHGQITLAPTNYGAAPAGSIFSWGYFNHDSTGRPTSKAKQGLLIDLETPSILFGSGDFSVDADGHLTAKGGGSIGGWLISDEALTSQDRKTNLFSTGGDEDLRIAVGRVRTRDGRQVAKFGVYGDGSFFAANDKFSVDKDGYITATGGTIGGWNLDDDSIYCMDRYGNIITELDDDGTIYCNNLVAYNTGWIAGWKINKNELVNGGFHIASGAGEWNERTQSYGQNAHDAKIYYNNGKKDMWSINGDGEAFFDDLTAGTVLYLGKPGANYWYINREYPGIPAQGGDNNTFQFRQGCIGSTRNYVWTNNDPGLANGGFEFWDGYIHFNDVEAIDGRKSGEGWEENSIGWKVCDLAKDILKYNYGIDRNENATKQLAINKDTKFTINSTANFNNNVSFSGRIYTGPSGNAYRGMTTRVNFSDGTYMDFINGLLVDGISANGRLQNQDK